jgi:prepilin-type N-terminal cleavage/methylation domain-containing protein
MKQPFLKLDSRGFTLVEMVVVMPIVSLIVIMVFGYMFSSYGAMLQQNEEANLRLEGAVMLFDLEDELLFTTDYGSTISSDLSDPRSPSGGWTYNTNPDTLIIYETSLTAPRRDPNREFVYKNLYGCTGANSAFNPIALNNIVYFTTQNTNNPYRTLYRRTITPQYTTCNNGYKRFTCPVAFVGTGPCQAQDSKLSENIVDFRVEYYDENNLLLSTPPTDPSSAEKIKIIAVLGKQIYGKDLQTTTSITMKKIN